MKVYTPTPLTLSILLHRLPPSPPSLSPSRPSISFSSSLFLSPFYLSYYRVLPLFPPRTPPILRGTKDRPILIFTN
jgi:hypothetical protein